MKKFENTQLTKQCGNLKKKPARYVDKWRTSVWVFLIMEYIKLSKFYLVYKQWTLEPVLISSRLKLLGILLKIHILDIFFYQLPSPNLCELFDLLNPLQSLWLVNETKEPQTMFWILDLNISDKRLTY